MGGIGEAAFRKSGLIQRKIGGLLLVILLIAWFSPAQATRSQDNLPPAWKAQLDSLTKPVYDPQLACTISRSVVLQRDAARFVFKSGNLFFFAGVRGRVTGAFFQGEANSNLSRRPPSNGSNCCVLPATRSGAAPSMSCIFVSAIPHLRSCIRNFRRRCLLS